MNGTKRKYACPVCGKLYDTEAEAAWCAKKHTARDIAHAEVTAFLGELAQYLLSDVGSPYNNG